MDLDRNGVEIKDLAYLHKHPTPPQKKVAHITYDDVEPADWSSGAAYELNTRYSDHTITSCRI